MNPPTAPPASRTVFDALTTFSVARASKTRRSGWSKGVVLAVLAVLVLLGVLASCGSADDDGASTTTSFDAPRGTGHVSKTYAQDESWLCLPGGDEDVCESADLTATEVRRDLSTIDVPFEPASDPTVDCFYVYPTVRGDFDGPNASPDVPRDPEEAVVRDEAARFSSVCRVFAPWYPQATGAEGVPPSPEREQVAYDAVVDAFLHYLDQHNEGRPFVLIGHGQGADLLTRLVQEQVEPDPARLGQLVSALLIGSTRLFVPDGALVGGSFTTVPLCTDRAQNGCVVAYHAFQRGVPPPPGGGPLYASIPEGTVAPCANPAGLDGSKGQLRGAYFPGTDAGLPPVPTPFVLFRELYRGECTTRNGVRYLAVDLTTDPNDVRPLGPVEDAPGQEADLGLHDLELELTLGDLLALVETQSEARH